MLPTSLDSQLISDSYTKQQTQMLTSDCTGYTEAWLKLGHSLVLVALYQPVEHLLCCREVKGETKESVVW